MKPISLLGLLLLSVSLPSVAKDYPFPRPAFKLTIPDDWHMRMEPEPMTFIAPDGRAHVFIRTFDMLPEAALDLFFPQWQQEFMTVRHQGIAYTTLNTINCLTEQGEGVYKTGELMVFALTLFAIDDRLPTYLIGTVFAASEELRYRPVMEAILASLQIEAIEEQLRQLTVGQMVGIGAALHLYHLDRHEFPPALNDLLLMYYQQRLTDAWGAEFQYVREDAGYTLKSLGKDQTPGGIGVNTDIVYINGQFVSGHQPMP